MDKFPYTPICLHVSDVTARSARSVVSVGGGDGGFLAVGVIAWRWWAVGGRSAYSAKVGKVKAKNARQGAGGCTKALRGPAPVPPKTLI